MADAAVIDFPHAQEENCGEEVSSKESRPEESEPQEKADST
jgi:hypothetical protein